MPLAPTRIKFRRSLPRNSELASIDWAYSSSMFGSILIHALKMGSGASTAKDALEPLLLSQELVEGSNTLGSDNTFRISFTNYIKSGAWLNSLSHLVPDFQIILGTSTQKDGDYIRCLHEYNIEHDALVALTAANNENKSPPPSPSVPGGTERILTQRIVKTPSFGIDDYLCSSSSFSQEELLVMLFAILYPIYITSREYKRYLEHGIESNALLPNDDSGSMASGSQPGSNLVQTSQSRRAQELLLGCAAYHDESYLQEYLQDSNWLGRVCTIFHDHPLALCITDTRKTGLPILFANKAFCNLFGYAESAIIGSNLSILCGLCTEASQLKRLHESIHSTEPVKFSITLQSKSKKPLFDLMAQKAVGSYSISAHFVKLKSTQLDALNVSQFTSQCNVSCRTCVYLCLLFPNSIIDGGRYADVSVLPRQSTSLANQALLAACPHRHPRQKRHQRVAARFTVQRA